jgi:hypothetical protein
MQPRPSRGAPEKAARVASPPAAGVASSSEIVSARAREHRHDEVVGALGLVLARELGVAEVDGGLDSEDRWAT